jgi:hypothetical protein
MSALVLLMLAAVGLVAGFVAGMIGIGGGVLIVPFLYFFYAHPDWSGFAFPEAFHPTVAHATSLLIIVPTALRGTWSYSNAGLIVWRVALPVAAAAIAGGIVGAHFAIGVPAPLLKVMFGGFLVASALQLALGRSSDIGGPLRTNFVATTFTGLAVGILSGMMGVGGGILALPLLMHVLHVDLRRAAATSLAIVGAAALASVTTYAIAGMNAVVTPAGSIGYVHVYAALPILIGAVLSVHWGTRANQRLNAVVLRRIFAVFFLLMGLQFVIENIAALL